MRIKLLFLAAALAATAALLTFRPRPDQEPGPAWPAPEVHYFLGAPLLKPVVLVPVADLAVSRGPGGVPKDERVHAVLVGKDGKPTRQVIRDGPNFWLIDGDTITRLP
jgi:hypothetical protein